MVTIIMPVYNERSTLLAALYELICIFGKDCQIIVVDNGSTDGSLEIIKTFVGKHKSYPLEFYQCMETGKANAIRYAINQIKYDDVILHDADLEYDLYSIKLLHQLHKATGADMTIGIRKRKLWRSSIANAIICLILNIRYSHTTVKDALTGARVVRRNLLTHCKSSGFGLETELSALALKYCLKITEDECEYRPRIIGKKIKPWHIFQLMRIAIWG